MKKFILIALSIFCLVLIFVVLRPSQKQTSSSSSNANTSSDGASGKVDAIKAARATRSGSIGTDYLTTVRAAIALGDRGSIDDAFASLVEYLNAHPEKVDEYVGTLRSEKDEQVLRTFALALAQSQAGLLENPKIIQTAIEMSKDSSFEQRQHIMLNLMAKFPEIRDDVLQNVVELSDKDPNSQVKTSAVVVLADWMDKFPDKSAGLLDQIGSIFNTATDPDVRGFTYQILALKKDKLSREMQSALSERLKIETDSFSGNLIVSALSAAPDDIRESARTQIQNAFNVTSDMEKKRNLLAQLVCLGRGDSVSILDKNSEGTSPLAEDAREYKKLLADGALVAPEVIFQNKAERDASKQPFTGVDKH